jgi:death on curing protein
VARPRTQPRWLTRLAVDAIHHDQIREHGGLPAVRDENALESALARPQQRWHYAQDADLPALAAAYAFGLARNHPYRDGNKRIAFLALVVFLELNGLAFDATEVDVVTTIVMLADGRLSEERLADWVRARTQQARRPHKSDPTRD